MMLYNRRFKTRFKQIVHCHSENLCVDTEINSGYKIIDIITDNGNVFLDYSTYKKIFGVFYISYDTINIYQQFMLVLYLLMI